MIKILMTTARMPVNGISNVIIQYCNYIDKEKFQVDLLTSKIDPIYERQFEKTGGKLTLWPDREENQIMYLWKLTKLLKRGKYDILHTHGNSATMAIEMLAAKLAKIPVRISHSHNTTCTHKILDKILRPIFYYSYTEAIACGEAAGKWMYRNNTFTTINNGVDLSKFSFNILEREKLRKKLNVEDKFVIGHIGRFTYQKNHEFLLNVFIEVLKKREDAVLILIGTGPKLEEIKDKVIDLGIEKKVMFYGVTDQAALFYSAFDMFVLPSRFEGLPFVLVETQACGLPTIVSKNVTSEVVCTDFTKQLSIDRVDEWVSMINEEKCTVQQRGRNSVLAQQKLQCLGYSINYVIQSLEKFYVNSLNNKVKI